MSTSILPSQLDRLDDFDLSHFSWSKQKISIELKDCSYLSQSLNSGEITAFILYRDVGVAIEISFLYVLPIYRRSGQMTQLLGQLLQLFSDREIWLEVSHRNHPAITFYQKLGFQTLRRRPSYYKDGSDALVMGLAIRNGIC